MIGWQHISVEVRQLLASVSEVYQLTITAPASTEQNMSEIPDISDSPPLAGQSGDPSGSMAKLNIDDKGADIKDEEIPDIDDIPDMDEAAGLEEEGDDAAVRIVHPSE